MKKNYRKEKDCLNCGSMVELTYCSNCGQENLEIEESFGHVMKHAVSDYFHFDHQLFRTLKPLFFQPGKLTTEYMAGHRAQYLHPVKMYIFISVVYFLLLFQSGAKTIQTGQVKPDIKTEQNKILPPTTNDTSYLQYAAIQQQLPVGKRDGVFARQYNKRAFFYQEKFGARAGEVFLDEFKHNVPKMMFLILPLFALILLIAFRKNKKYYVAHLIYSFHLHCFLFLFLAAIMLLGMALPVRWGLNGWLDLITAIGIIWYIYRSLQVVYHRSRWRTLSKMLGMTLSYFFVFVFCMCLVLLMTAIIIPN
jgi:hypothetical protein